MAVPAIYTAICSRRQMQSTSAVSFPTTSPSPATVCQYQQFITPTNMVMCGLRTFTSTARPYPCILYSSCIKASHIVPPFIRIIDVALYILCYNIATSYISPPIRVGETGVAPIRAELAAPPLPKWLCLLFHHSPTLKSLYPPIKLLSNFLLQSDYCKTGNVCYTVLGKI